MNDETTDKLPASTPATSSSTSVAVDGQLLETTGVKPGVRTSEFWLTLLAIMLTACFAEGVFTDSPVAKVAGIAGTVLTALGYKVSRTIVKTAAPILLAMLLWPSSGCAWFKGEAKQVAHDVIDCTKGAAPSAIKEFGPLADALLVYATGGNGMVNTDAIKDAGKHFAKEVGGCVIADAVARALIPKPADPNAPKSSPLEADPASLHAVIAEMYPGVKFQTVNGSP